MTNEEKNKVLAELDGFEWFTDALGYRIHAKPYTESYDLIIPLIQKQPSHIKAWTEKELGLEYWVAAVMATPSQLCDALIKAVGKWKE